MSHILALDQGTTSSRALIFDHAGQIVAMAQEEFPQHFPRSGWVEHDPMDIWNSQEKTARAALKKAGLAAKDLTAVGITNQRETTLIWERATGKPIGPAIVWQDRRTASFCDELERDGGGVPIERKTGLRIDPYFSGTKIRWMLDHVDGARVRAEKGELAFGTVDTWLLWQLTGGEVHATDPSNASRTLLYNIHEHAWDPELLKLLDIPESLLPEVKPSSGIFGEGAKGSVCEGVPIAGIGGDQQAALFGQACFQPGMAKNTYGTGCFLLMQTGDHAQKSENNLLTTAACQPGDEVRYALEGSVFIGGAVVQWLRDGLGIIQSAPEIEKLATSVPDSGGVFFVPAFSGLGAPHWDPEARGIIVGIERGTTAAHIARAAMEGICYQVADLLTAMDADAEVPLSELRVDGGASANDLLMQMQADLIQVPVVRPKCVETTALGAAYLAGLATGFWKDLDEIAAQWQVDKTFEPKISAAEAKARRRQWNRAVERSKRWTEDD